MLSDNKIVERIIIGSFCDNIDSFNIEGRFIYSCENHFSYRYDDSIKPPLAADCILFDINISTRRNSYFNYWYSSDDCSLEGITLEFRAQCQLCACTVILDDILVSEYDGSPKETITVYSETYYYNNISVAYNYLFNTLSIKKNNIDITRPVDGFENNFDNMQKQVSRILKLNSIS